MKDKDLCKWLRDNSSGSYRKSAIAADRIENLLEWIKQEGERNNTCAPTNYALTQTARK